MSDRKINIEPDIRIRLFSDDELAYGKGVNRLLTLCEQCRSLHKAAEKMNMSYRKALQIVQRAEKSFRRPILNRTIGGKDGGGSELTLFGAKLVAEFSRMETEILEATRKKIRRLELLQAEEINRNQIFKTNSMVKSEPPE